jgi:transposase
LEPIFKYPFGPRGLCWLNKQDFGFVDNVVRDKLIATFRHYTAQVEDVNQHLEKLEAMYPQIESLTVLRGIGTYTAMLIIGALGDVARFGRAKLMASFAGLTARVNQSREHCYHDHISKQGFPG